MTVPTHTDSPTFDFLEGHFTHGLECFGRNVFDMLAPFVGLDVTITIQAVQPSWDALAASVSLSGVLSPEMKVTTFSGKEVEIPLTLLRDQQGRIFVATLDFLAYAHEVVGVADAADRVVGA